MRAQVAKSVEIVSFTVEGVPVPWMRSEQCGKRHYSSPAMTAAKERIAYAFCAGASRAWPLDGRYKLSLRFVLPDYHQRDWDNLGKLVSDALKNLAWHDDNQVMRAIVDKVVDVGRPSRTDVEIEYLGKWPVPRRRRSTP